MADLMPCPSCKATLRVPEGADAIRCPQCKTVVPLKKPPIAKAIPLPAAKPAIPLPFDKPGASPPPPPAVPVAKALPVEKTVVRGKVVREEEDDEDKPKKRRRDDDSIKNDPRYPKLEAECRMARIGVWIMAIGAILCAVQAFCYASFLAGVAAGSPIGLLFILPATLCLAAHLLAFAVGYGFCIAGPQGMRSTAIIGLVVTFLHAGLLVPLAGYGFTTVGPIREQATTLTHVDVSRIIFIFSSFQNNLNTLTDLPWMFVRGDFQREDWMYVALMLLGVVLEFAKFSVLGTIVQYYASEGKSHELGFKSLRFVYRIIWVVIVVGVLKILTLILLHLFGGETLAPLFLIPQALFTVGYFFWWVFTWYAQFVAMRDSTEVITGARFLDRRQYVDYF